MSGGWVKLWRKSIKNGWLRNHKLWVFWCYCLMKATNQQTKVLIGLQEIFLEPGQFIFGRQKCSKDTGLSEQSVRTCLHNLQSTSNLTIKTTNKFSIISIINWSAYQSEENEINQQINQQSNKRLTTYKNSKEDKEYIVSLSEKNGHIPYEKIRGLYNTILSDLPTCRFMTDKRKTHLKSCWNQEPGRTDKIEFWNEIFTFISESDFLMGKTSKPFQGCDLEWITKISNFVKIREGKYHR